MSYVNSNRRHCTVTCIQLECIPVNIPSSGLHCSTTIKYAGKFSSYHHNNFFITSKRNGGLGCTVQINQDHKYFNTGQITKITSILRISIELTGQILARPGPKPVPVSGPRDGAEFI